MMKKISIVLAAIAMMAVACKSEKIAQTTHISGKVPAGIDEVNLLIPDLDLDTLITVTDGVFEADLNTCLTSMAYLGAGSYEAAFVLDGTPLEIELADTSVVHSLKPEISLQEAIENFREKSLDMQKAYYDSVEVISKADSLSDEEKEELLLALSTDNLQKYSDFNKEVIEKNKDNFLGALALFSIYDSMTDEELERVFGTLDSKLRKGEPLNVVWDNLRARKATSEGKPIKDFTANTVYDFDRNGEPMQTYISLSDIVDGLHYFIVSFWNSQSPACLQQIEILKAVAENFGPYGLGVISVAVLDDPKSALETAAKYGMNWPQINNVEPALVDEYGFRDLPVTLLVSPDGVIVKREDGLGTSVFESIQTYL
ncbi:MAG: TlpA family protein disulfide reductase [Bacteroidales bacterium]|nr:TlpA family protein disulfide reductase [Bacteroidales bacterium]